MSQPHGIEVTPLPLALGAVVRGLDVARITPDVARRLREAWHEHLVLFFPQLGLTDSQHIAFGQVFGDVTAISPARDDYRDLKRTGPNGEIFVLDAAERRADAWHSDVSFTRTPPIGSILSMQVCPDKGGDTLWTNQYAAYAALSPAVKALVDGLEAVHGRANTGSSVHPVVLTHAVTGRKALYVSPGFTSRIVGISAIESDALLAMLHRHCEQPEFQLRWKWQAGDAALWDNRCTMHRAVNDYGDAARIIHRVTIYAPGVIAAARDAQSQPAVQPA
jgi:taurine dioxygenase